MTLVKNEEPSFDEKLEEYHKTFCDVVNGIQAINSLLKEIKSLDIPVVEELFKNHGVIINE